MPPRIFSGPRLSYRSGDPASSANAPCMPEAHSKYFVGDKMRRQNFWEPGTLFSAAVGSAPRSRGRRTPLYRNPQGLAKASAHAPLWGPCSGSADSLRANHSDALGERSHRLPTFSISVYLREQRGREHYTAFKTYVCACKGFWMC